MWGVEGVGGRKGGVWACRWDGKGGGRSGMGVKPNGFRGAPIGVGCGAQCPWMGGQMGLDEGWGGGGMDGKGGGGWMGMEGGDGDGLGGMDGWGANRGRWGSIQRHQQAGGLRSHRG